ncbi:DNA glycosylase [Nemania sp. FL0916]|nr:DNA glycosylase [Nemania sp. FL0916]
MSPLRVSEWRKLPLSLTELCIETTLRCGQSFRWRKINDEWNCALAGRLLSLKQDESYLHYKVTWPNNKTGRHRSAPLPKETPDVDAQPSDDTEALLKHYFNLDHDLTALYGQWSELDANFKKKAPKFTGIRILRQDAWETIITFICSSNNHISRITNMVNQLCVHYGPLVGHVGDEAFHDIPPPDALTGKGVEAHLRELGFGYRAKYIAGSATMIATKNPAWWLDSLTNPKNPRWVPIPVPAQEEPITYERAHKELLLLSGVGPKVADCICLMGLGWSEAVPVDTHVWQIAQRDYHFGKSKSKTFSTVMYHSVGNHFRKLWGPYAGWAQSVLFTANLKSFAQQAAATPTATSVTVEVKQEIEESSPIITKRRRRVTTSEPVKVEHDIPSDTKPVDRKKRKTRR